MKLSNKNQNADNVKKPKVNKQQQLVRYLCLFLAILMILSCVSVLAYVFGSSWNVAADGYQFPNDLIAVGLECGKGEVAVGFELSTTNGFVVNTATIGRNDRSVRRIYSLTEEKVYITNDINLSKNTSGDYVAASGTVHVGGYHLEIMNLDIKTEADLKKQIETVDGLLSGTSYRAIPCYIDNKYIIRVGDFSTSDRANKELTSLSALSGKYKLSIAEPSSTAVSVVDPTRNLVVFEYDGYNQLGLSSTSEGQYMRTYDGRTYGGTMCYKRADGGVQVTSLVDFEQYVPCVVPFEVSSGWPYNALTSFSIVVRTYALNHKNSKFDSFGVDVYDDSYDQVYGGYSRVNDRVLAACRDTKGLVAFYGGKLASLYYSSSTGGYVVSNAAAWGGTAQPYLQSKATPWENYKDKSKGMWSFEVSPQELATYLRSKGYSSLTSPIASVEIKSKAGPTDYVTSVEVTDTAGHKVTIGNTTAKVKSAFAVYLNSANFVVGKGSVELDYVVPINIDFSDKPTQAPGFLEKFPDFFDKFYIVNYNVQTKKGIYLGGKEDALSIITQSGRKSVSTQMANILTAKQYRDMYAHPENYKGINIDKIYEYSSNIQTTQPVYNGEGGVQVDFQKMTQTYTAKESAANFVFAGKGWGHGVGMSQCGVFDLANAGMSGVGILKTYFDGITIGYYK